MGTISVKKLGGLSLILGPVIALIFYFIQPGNLLIDNADPADAAASIGAVVSNATLAHLTGFIIPIGLLMMLYGLNVVVGGVRDNGNGDALARYGMQLITIAVIGWVLSQGFVHVLAGNAGPAAGAVYAVSQAVSLTSALVAGLGFLILSLGLSTRDDFNKIAALLVAAVSIVALVFLTIGVTDKSQLNLAVGIAGIAYVIWSLWGIMLGLALLKQE